MGVMVANGDGVDSGGGGGVGGGAVGGGVVSGDSVVGGVDGVDGSVADGVIMRF